MDFFYLYENEKILKYENEDPKIKTTLNEIIEGGKIFSLEEFHLILFQAFSILDELRAVFPPILHNKINPSNILLDEEKNNIAFVNFNLGNQKEIFLAPEHNYPTPKTDLYSLGITMLKLLGLDFSDIKKDENKEIILDKLELDENNKKLLYKMIASNPNNRFRDMKEAKIILNKITTGEITSEDWMDQPLLIENNNLLAEENNYYDKMDREVELFEKKKSSYMKLVILGVSVIAIVLYMIVSKM